METVRVTKQDIDKGIPLNPEACPIALALKRRYPHRHVVVGRDYVEVEGSRFTPSQAMLNFITVADHPHNYDYGRPKPCTLTMTEWDAEDYEKFEQN